MSTFFQTARLHLVQADAYRARHGHEPGCSVSAPLTGGCTGLNGLTVWRSLPVALQARRTSGRTA